MNSRALTLLLASLVAIGCRQDPRPVEVREFEALLPELDWKTYSEIYYPGEGYSIVFLPFGVVARESGRMNESWTVREPDIVEITNIRNESRRYRRFAGSNLMAYCHPGFTKPFLIAPEPAGYDSVLEIAREVGVAVCDAMAVFRIAGAGIEPRSDSLAGLRSLDLSGMEFTWQLRRAVRSVGAVDSIDLSDTDTEDDYLASVASVQGLVNLNLANTKVTDLGLRFLTEVRSLQQVDVTGTTVTPDGVAFLERQIDGVTVRSSL